MGSFLCFTVMCLLVKAKMSSRSNTITVPKILCPFALGLTLMAAWDIPNAKAQRIGSNAWLAN